MAVGGLLPGSYTHLCWSLVTSTHLLIVYGSAERLQHRPSGPQSLRYLLSGPSQKKLADLYK